MDFTNSGSKLELHIQVDFKKDEKGKLDDVPRIKKARIMDVR